MFTEKMAEPRYRKFIEETYDPERHKVIISFVAHDNGKYVVDTFFSEGAETLRTTAVAIVTLESILEKMKEVLNG